MPPYPRLTWPDTTPEFHFWHKLPWAVPGSVTFVLGAALFVGGLWAAYRQPKYRAYYASFALFCAACGFIGLERVMAALVVDTDYYRAWLRYTLIGTTLIVPSGLQFVYYFTGARNRKLRFVTFLTWPAWVATALGALSGELFAPPELWSRFTAGIFPRLGGLFVPLMLIGLAGGLFLALPALRARLLGNVDPGTRALAAGTALIMPFVTADGAVVLGVPVIPLGYFLFAPLLLMAYGTVRSNLLDLNHVLYDRAGLYYLFNALLAATFLAMSLMAAWLVPTNSLENLHWSVAPAILSSFSLFLVGIFVGGTDPRAPLNQWASYSLYALGFLIVTVVVFNLNLDLRVARSLARVFAIFFAFGISAIYRCALLSLGRPIPRGIIILDAVGVVIALLALTPYFHPGYYRYPFGIHPAAGPGLLLLGLSGTIVLARVFILWRRAGESRLTSRRAGIIYILVAGGMAALGLPSAFGIPLYGPLQFLFVPTLILGYFVLRRGGSVMRREALRINRRMTLVVILMAPPAAFLYYLALAGHASTPATWYHVCITLTPFFLLIVQSTFLFSRPVSDRVEVTMAELTAARADAEFSRIETEKLNELIRAVNSRKFLNDAIDELLRYLEREFSVQNSAILFVDREKRQFYASRARSTTARSLGAEKIRYIRAHRVSIESPAGGVCAAAYQKSRMFYRSWITTAMRDSLEECDRRLAVDTNMTGYLVVPLISNSVVVAVLVIANFGEPLKFSLDELNRIARACDQVAGAVAASFSWKEAELSRIAAEQARRQAEQLREELEREIKTARKVQKSLLPTELPTPAGGALDFIYIPMHDIGGDFVDLHYDVDRRRLGFFICDVSGHGVAAAFLASMVKMSLHNWHDYMHEPVELLTRLQSSLRGKMAGLFLTACSGCLDFERGHLRVVSAGHPPPLRLSASGSISEMPTRGPMILDTNYWKPDFHELHTELEPGDRLILYTDGGPEARNAEGELLGDETFMDIIKRHSHMRPNQICFSTYMDTVSFAGSGDLDDDFTMLVIEYSGDEPRTAGS